MGGKVKPMPAKHDWTYDQFVRWACEQLAEGIMTEGFKGMRTVFKYQIMNQLHLIYTGGGFKETK